MLGQWAHRAAPAVVATVIAVGAVVAVTDIAEHGGSSAGPPSAGTAAPAPSPRTVTRSPRRTVTARAKPPSGPVLVAQVQPSEAVTAAANRTPAPHRTSPAPQPTRTPVPPHTPAPPPSAMTSPPQVPPPPSPAPTPTAAPTPVPSVQPACAAEVTVLGVTVCAGLRTGG
jgi:hypothetical protein